MHREIVELQRFEGRGG